MHVTAALALPLIYAVYVGVAEAARALALDVAAGFLAQLLALRLARPWFSAEAAALFDKLLAMLPRRA